MMAKAFAHTLGMLLLGTGISAAQGATNIVAPRNAVAHPPAPLLVRPNSLPGAFGKDAPMSLADVRMMERHLTNLVARVSPAVVAVRVGRTTGSGVVISDQGFVLCAAHVCGLPNREVQLLFPNGKSARGTTLGTDHEMDAGLIRILEKGPWPHVPVGQVNQSNLGDWVLALGHPGGFDPHRPAVVRFGRIISLTRGALRTDCTLLGGDSGGPLFDMYGRVIGIHSRISESTAENFHVPIDRFLQVWDRLAKGEDWGRPATTWWATIGAGSADHPQGCQLDRVDENGPAIKAGLRVGDIISAINGRKIDGSLQFRDLVRHSKPGDELTLAVRRNQQQLSFKVTAEAGRRRRASSDR